MRRIRHLSGSELLFLLEAQIALTFCELARRRRPVGALLATQSGTAARNEISPSRDDIRKDLRIAATVGWAVTRAARYGLVRSQCLVRSLAIQRMLERRGIRSSELKIGIRMDGGQLLAHAWVELYGAVVGDTVRYVRSFEPAPNLSMVQL